MKTIVKVFLFLGIVFWGFGLAYSLSMLFALNGLGKVFRMEIADEAITQVTHDSLDIIISYSYQVNGKEFRKENRMLVDYYRQSNIDSIIVKYNRTFPRVSYIEGIALNMRRQKTGIVISSFFLLFLLVLWKLSNRKRWIYNYTEVGNRPWLHPVDQEARGFWKRIWSRFFQK